MQWRQQKGFTLLELMLVLVIISALLVAAINNLQARALQQKIEKTALRMDMWLQASASFYNENGLWPLKLEDVVEGGFMKGPESGSSYNPYFSEFGTPYRVVTDNLKEQSSPGGTTQMGWGRMFGISTVLPSEGWARQVAGKVPSGIVAPNAGGGYKVLSFSTIPGALNNPGRMQTFGVYRVGENKLGHGGAQDTTLNYDNWYDHQDNRLNWNRVTVKMPVCPSNWLPSIVYGMVDFRYSKNLGRYPEYQQAGGRLWKTKDYEATGYNKYDERKFYPVNASSVRCELKTDTRTNQPVYELTIETQGLAGLRGSSMLTDYMATDDSMQSANWTAPGLWFDMPYGNSKNAINKQPGDAVSFHRFSSIDRRGASAGEYTFYAFCSDSDSSHDSSNCPVKRNPGYKASYSKGTTAVWQGPFIDPYHTSQDPRHIGNSRYGDGMQPYNFNMPYAVQFGGPKPLFGKWKESGKYMQQNHDYAGKIYMPDIFGADYPMIKPVDGEEVDPFGRARNKTKGKTQVAMDVETEEGHGGALFVATRCIRLDSRQNIDPLIALKGEGGFKMDACNDPSLVRAYPHQRPVLNPKQSVPLPAGDGQTGDMY